MSAINLITDYKTELEQIRAAKTALLTNGQKHSLNGSHTFEGVTYKELVRREQQIINALTLLNGGKSYTVPNFA